jgi:putative transposase
MPFWRLYYHLTWSTKDREPLITPDIEPRLFAYIVKKAAELGVFTYAINSWTEHLHVVSAIPPKVAVAELVKFVKGASSHYLNHECHLGYEFAWQRGYGALSIGEKQRPIAEEYVRNQKTHHEKQTAISWLERYTDIDEGPSDGGMKPTSTSALREDRPPYEILGEPPF